MKIGLLSLSGIRVHDQQLLAQGLRLPGLVERSRAIASLPNLGLLILGGLTPKEHELHYIDIDPLEELAQLDQDFDLVAISSYSARIKDAYRVAHHFRCQGTTVVMGGLHVSCLPEEAIQHCDAVMLGEGELLWPKVLQDIEAKTLQPIYDARQQEFDLAQAPLPAYSLLDPTKYNRITVQASRGCPFRCEFCASSILLTQRYKQKPIAKVLEEIDLIRSIWHRPFIEFTDDNAFVNKPYWKQLLTELKPRNIRWFAETDISVSEDEELLRLMQESNCAQVLIGLESPTQEGLESIEMRRDWKYHQAPKYLKSIRKIQSHGIRVIGCFVVGLDGHSSHIFEDIYQFSIDSEMFDIQITLPTPFPATPFYERLKREDRLIDPYAWEKCTLFDLNFRPKKMSASELSQGFRALGFRLYSEELTQWRRKNFSRHQKVGLI